jgi:hypothetical protein
VVTVYASVGSLVEQCQRPVSDELFSGPKLEPDTALIRNRSANPYRVRKNCPSQRGNKKFRNLFTSFNITALIHEMQRD